jgi:hypothetical protein
MNNEYLYKIIYNSGDIFLPEAVKNILQKDIIGSSEKTFYISGWSIVHFINGIIFGYLYLYFEYDIRSYFLTMFILHTLWELWQSIIGMAKPYKITGRSNIVDTIMDTILFMCGSYIIFLRMKGQ